MTARKYNAFESIGFVLIGLGLTAPFAALTGQALWSLRYAQWPELPLAHILNILAIPVPHFTWLGVQVILGWVLALPLAMATLVVPAFGFWLVHIGIRSR